MERRFSILKGACRGIVYLHTATPPMIHQDIKTLGVFILVVFFSPQSNSLYHSSANILLDSLYQPKLGDFGFSIELPRISSGQTLFTAEFVARSEGYYPSELSAGKLSDRTDIIFIWSCKCNFCSLIKQGKLVYEPEVPLWTL